MSTIYTRLCRDCQQKILHRFQINVIELLDYFTAQSFKLMAYLSINLLKTFGIA